MSRKRMPLPRRVADVGEVDQAIIDCLDKGLTYVQTAAQLSLDYGRVRYRVDHLRELYEAEGLAFRLPEKKRYIEISKTEAGLSDLDRGIIADFKRGHAVARISRRTGLCEPTIHNRLLRLRENLGLEAVPFGPHERLRDVPPGEAPSLPPHRTRCAGMCAAWGAAARCSRAPTASGSESAPIASATAPSETSSTSSTAVFCNHLQKGTKMTDTQETAPAGYMQDSQGRLVPSENIRPIDRARDDLVREIVAHALGLSKAIQAFKTQTFDDIDAFVELSAEEYGIKLGRTKGNLSLLSFDGRYRVVRAMAESIRFDERLLAAKQLVDECIKEWSQGSRPELKTLIDQAFQTDRAGNLNTARILALRRLEIDDARWQQAMKALSEAVQVVGSKPYVRVYQRDAKGDYQPITLDVAGA